MSPPTMSTLPIFTKIKVTWVSSLHLSMIPNVVEMIENSQKLQQLLDHAIFMVQQEVEYIESKDNQPYNPFRSCLT